MIGSAGSISASHGHFRMTIWAARQSAAKGGNKLIFGDGSACFLHGAPSLGPVISKYLRNAPPYPVWVGRTAGWCGARQPAKTSRASMQTPLIETYLVFVGGSDHDPKSCRDGYYTDSALAMLRQIRQSFGWAVAQNVNAHQSGAPLTLWSPSAFIFGRAF